MGTNRLPKPPRSPHQHRQSVPLFLQQLGNVQGLCATLCWCHPYSPGIASAIPVPCRGRGPDWRRDTHGHRDTDRCRETDGCRDMDRCRGAPLSAAFLMGMGLSKPGPASPVLLPNLHPTINSRWLISAPHLPHSASLYRLGMLLASQALTTVPFTHPQQKDFRCSPSGSSISSEVAPYLLICHTTGRCGCSKFGAWDSKIPQAGWWKSFSTLLRHHAQQDKGLLTTQPKDEQYQTNIKAYIHVSRPGETLGMHAAPAALPCPWLRASGRRRMHGSELICLAPGLGCSRLSASALLHNRCYEEKFHYRSYL